MNIMLINHYAGSKKHGMEYRPYYMAREWVKLGHAVSIVAGSVSHVRNQQPDMRGKVTGECIDGIRYMWLQTPGYHGNGVRRVLNIVSFVRRLSNLGKNLANEFRPDVVVASSTYPLDIYPAYNIAKSASAKLIFEVHDLWPLSPIELGNMSKWNPFIMVMQMAENHAYRVADRVVSMLPKACNHMKDHGMAPHKFNYIPNGIVVEEWENDNATLPQQHFEVLDKLRQKGRFVVGYAGAHGLANSLHSLIEAASLIGDQPFSIVLVGQGPEKEALQRMASDLKLTKIVFLPPVSKSAIPELLDFMDALYIGLQRQPLFRFGVSPNKLMDYMMSATPVIQAIEAGNDLVAESGCGISVPPENPKAVAEAIIKLMNMTPIERRAIGLRGKDYVLANHDYRFLAQQFLTVMDS